MNNNFIIITFFIVAVVIFIQMKKTSVPSRYIEITNPILQNWKRFEFKGDDVSFQAHGKNASVIVKDKTKCANIYKSNPKILDTSNCGPGNLGMNMAGTDNPLSDYVSLHY